MILLLTTSLAVTQRPKVLFEKHSEFLNWTTEKILRSFSDLEDLFDQSKALLYSKNKKIRCKIMTWVPTFPNYSSSSIWSTINTGDCDELDSFHTIHFKLVLKISILAWFGWIFTRSELDQWRWFRMNRHKPWQWWWIQTTWWSPDVSRQAERCWVYSLVPLMTWLGGQNKLFNFHFKSNPARC